MSFVIQHVPHVIPVVIVWGILIRFWLAQRRLEGEPGTSATEAPGLPAGLGQPPAAARPIQRSVAVRGLVALGPVIGALATGVVIYGLNLGARHSAAAIWIHVGISLLALLLVGYKVAEIGSARLRESIRGAGLVRSGASVVLLALSVPLVVSGVALVVYPSAASFTAYAHLVASAWWTGLLLWHLRRYLRRAIGVALRRPDQASAGQASVGSRVTPEPASTGRRSSVGWTRRARPASRRGPKPQPSRRLARRESAATAAPEGTAESVLGR